MPHRAGALPPPFATVDPVGFRNTLLLPCALALAAGCSRAPEYELRGQVLAVHPEQQRITVKHEDIVGFMPAMTMAFRVERREEFEARVPGELIRATLVVGDGEVHLEDVTRTGEAPLAETPPRTFDLVEQGEAVPDEPFVDQRGASTRLSDWRGQAVAITFIYTRCPLPDFCPRMDGHFAAVRDLVEQDPAFRGRVRLVSVSFDPDYDRPRVLAAHAKRVGADGATWRFVTGDREDIDRFASRFGVSVIREGQAAADIVHNLRTAVIDPAGRLATVLGGNDWTPAELAEALRKALGGR